MKQYVIDELREPDIEKLERYLTERFGPATLDRVYWVPLDEACYNDIQAAHTDCHPLYFAVQLKPGALVGEFLLRTHNRVRCDCMAYANENQQRWLMDVMDGIAEELELLV